MNLVMLDIDGTLTQSYEYDKLFFARAITEVTGVQAIDLDWSTYPAVTATGVTAEAIRRATGKPATSIQIKRVERELLLQLECHRRQAPADFRQVPGAAEFIRQLKQIDNTAVAIATGCWHSEALLKLQASGLDVSGIPLASSDDSSEREGIMISATRRALDAYGVVRFQRIVYIGDGVWDVTAAKSLGYRFIGVGARLQALHDAGARLLHEDYTELPKVLASVRTALQGGLAGSEASRALLAGIALPI